MARHRRRQRRPTNTSFQALPVNGVLSLGTLANATALAGALTVITDDFWFQSGDLSWTLDGMTAGEGPIYVGLSNGDLSVSEIKESINAIPTSRSDIINRERARRPIRRVGQFSVVDTGEKLFDGRTERQTIKMYVAEATQLNFFAFNQSGASLTTGGVLSVYGTLYGNWK